MYSNMTCLRGVEIKISCARLSQPFQSSMAWCALAKVPCGSVLKNTRAHARMKFSWNIRWWKLRCHPFLSRASRASLHACIRAKPSRFFPAVRLCMNLSKELRGWPWATEVRARSTWSWSNAS